MGRVKFTPPPRGKGFSNIPNAQYMIASLKAKLDEDEQQEEKHLKEIKERDQKAEANLKEVQQTQEQNLKEINMDDSIYKTKMSAMNTNVKQEILNFQAEKANILNEKSTLDSLIEFAPSLLEAGQKIRQKDWSATMEGSYNYHMTHGLPDDIKLKLELMEDAQWKQGVGFDIIADNMQAEGYQPKEVQWVRFKNKAADYGRLKAYGNLALKDLVPTAKQEMIKRGITDPAEMKAFMRDFEIQYLKAHNLYDPEKQKAISTDFLAEGLESVATAKALLLNQAENVVAYDKADERAKGDLLLIQNNLNAKVVNYELAGQSINNLFDSHKRRWDRKTGTVFTNKQARDAVIADLEDVTKFPNDEHVELALRAAQGNDNYYTDRIPELLSKRAANRTKLKDNKDKAEGIRFTNDVTKAKKYFQPTAEDIKNGTGYDGSFESAEAVYNKLADRYPSRIVELEAELGKYLEWTPQGRLDGDWATGHYWAKHDDYTLTTEDLNSHDIPPEFKTLEMRQKIARREKIINAANYDENWKTGIENALTNSLVTEDIKRGGAKDESFEPAAKHAEAKFKACIVNGGHAKECAAEIRDEIEDGVENGKGAFVLGYYGKKGKLMEGTKKGSRSFFLNFSPQAIASTKLAVEDFTQLNAGEADEAVAMVDDKNHLVHNYLFLKEKQLVEIHNAIKNGHPFRYPRILKRITDLNPEYFGSQYDVFKAQVEVAKRLGIFDAKFEEDPVNPEGKAVMVRGPLQMQHFMKTWHRDTKDPKARKFIEKLSTLDDVRKGITLTYRPEAVREPQFMSEGVVEELNKVPVDPILLAEAPDGSVDFNIGTIESMNEMITASKGVVNKDEAMFDGNFIKTVGGTSEYFKLHGAKKGWKYLPSKGWYKDGTVEYTEQDLEQWYQLEVR